jgi:hypothetical protein
MRVPAAESSVFLFDMQFLTVFRRRTGAFSDTEFTARVDAEVQQARRMYAQGAIRQIWHRADIPGACIGFRCELLRGREAMPLQVR